MVSPRCGRLIVMTTLPPLRVGEEGASASDSVSARLAEWDGCLAKAGDEAMLEGPRVRRGNATLLQSGRLPSARYAIGPTG
jgi:hypothetical protein